MLDKFIRTFVAHCELGGLIGLPKVYNSEGTPVVSLEDSNRTALLGAVSTSFERGMDPNEHRMTFMEVFRGLFNGFIDVEYRAGGGVEKLFADLRDYAEIMPIPPDVYNFKLTLM
uniref:Uncharacterized protein n=1 Tax=Moniliophthora roreri TaxID=221103 RepID=A0A0W0GBP8_MONRR